MPGLARKKSHRLALTQHIFAGNQQSFFGHFYITNVDLSN